MIFCDSHAHLYLEEFDPDRDATIRRAADAGVRYLFLPNIDSGSAGSLLALAGNYPGVCFPMMGLHPTSVRDNYREELTLVEQYLSDPGMEFKAIGEIGIDLYWDKTYESQQCDAFIHQLGLALQYDLPVAVHTRNSFDLTAGFIESRQDTRLKGVFHCFGGNLAQAQRAIRSGFLLGIGGVVTYKNSGLQKVVEAIPLEHLLLETDAPFLPPVPHRGERNESSYIPLIAQKIAEIKRVPLETVARVTTENAVRLFRV